MFLSLLQHVYLSEDHDLRLHTNDVRSAPHARSNPRRVPSALRRAAHACSQPADAANACEPWHCRHVTSDGSSVSRC